KANPGIGKNMKVRNGQKLVIPPPTVRIPEKIVPRPPVADSVVSGAPKNLPPPAAEKAVAVSEPTPVVLRTSATNPAEYPAVFSRYASGGFKMKKVRGAANFIGDHTSGNPYL